MSSTFRFEIIGKNHIAFTFRFEVLNQMLQSKFFSKIYFSNELIPSVCEFVNLDQKISHSYNLKAIFNVILVEKFYSNLDLNKNRICTGY